MKDIFRKQLRLGLGTAKARLKENERLYSLIWDIISAARWYNDLSLHEEMLADSVRVDTYADAIRRHIDSDDVVVDLGTGTGLLAILAARQGAKVYAIDHSEFINVAEQVARHNGVDDIDFRQTHSKDFTCPEKVDVILHEQIGHDLFEEKMVRNLLDLKQRLLKSSGTILPGEFDLFLEPTALNDEYRVPFIDELSVQGIDFGFLGDHPVAEKYKSDGYAQVRRMETAAFDHFLSTPEPALSVDLNALTDRDSIPTDLRASRRVVNPGPLDGFSLFFRTIFDDEIQFDTAPTHTNTHWRNRLFRTHREAYSEGEEISYAVTIGDLYDPDTWDISTERKVV